MADFTPKKIEDISQLNNGKEYINGVDIPDADDWNKVIESQLYTQGLAVNPPDDTEAGNVGTPSVEVVKAQDGSAKLKFKNLKGGTGATGATGATGDDALVYTGFFYDERYKDTLKNMPSTENLLITLGYFNRTPKVGETFLMFVYRSMDNSPSSIVTMEIKTVTANDARAHYVSEQQVTPLIGVQATVDEGTGTPAVEVSNVAPTAPDRYINPIFKLDFKNLKGKQGETGRAAEITNIQYQYATSTSGSTIPTTGWSFSIEPVKGRYLWARTIVTYYDGTQVISYNVSYVGTDGLPGAKGADGVTPTISSSTTTYQNSTNGNDIPTGTWTISPFPVKGQYTWSKTVTTWSTGGTTTTYAVAYEGKDGETISPSASTPLMDGTAEVGTLTTYARGDHRHPSDTSKANTSGIYPDLFVGKAANDSNGNLIISTYVPLSAVQTPIKVFDGQTNSTRVYNFSQIISNFDVLYFECFRDSDNICTTYAVPVEAWKEHTIFEFAPTASTDVWITVTAYGFGSFQVTNYNKGSIRAVWAMKLKN